MKGLAQPVVLLPVLLALTASCRGASRVSEMPDWSPAEVVGPAGMRVPEQDAQEERMRVPKPVENDGMRVPRTEVVTEIWPAEGLYIGGALFSTQMLGDFDGDQAFAGPTDFVLIPDTDVGAGVGLFVSYRWHMNELMLQYDYSEADGDFTGSPRSHDVEIRNVDLNWRHYFWEKSPLQPYGLLGIGMGEVEVDDGSVDQATQTQFQDATLEDGINVNVGAGVALYTLPWVVFFGQGMYRFGRYKTSDGIDGEFSNSPDVDGDAWEISVGAALRILPGRN